MADEFYGKRPMAFEIWLAYVVAAIVITVIPGPTVLLVVTQTLAHGRTAIVPLICGVLGGGSTAVFLSILGVGALLSASAVLFAWVKWIGAAYLIYLGITLWRNQQIGKLADTKIADASHQPATDPEIAPPTRTAHSFFLHSFIVTTFNPKGILFFIAFLPQFVNPAANVQLQLFILAITFVVIGSLNALCYAVFANRLKLLLDHKIARRWFNRCGGTALIGAGLWTAGMQRFNASPSQL